MQGQGGHCLVQARAGEAEPGEARKQRSGPGLAIPPLALRPQFSHLQDGSAEACRQVGVGRMQWVHLASTTAP